jgi:outer membrane autotransporter protein
LLLKVDLLSLDIKAPGLDQSTNLENFNVATRFGYKIDLPYRLYIEPTAGLEFVHTHFDEKTGLTPITVPLRDGSALQGRIGARFGTEWVTNNIRIEPSLTGYVYSILEATGTALFIGGTGITTPSDEGQVRGELQAAVNFFNLTTGWSGFARGDIRFGSDLIAASGKLGLRYQW